MPSSVENCKKIYFYRYKRINLQLKQNLKETTNHPTQLVEYPFK